MVNQNIKKLRDTTHVRISRKLHAKLKRKAEEENVTISELAEKLIDEGLVDVITYFQKRYEQKNREELF